MSEIHTGRLRILDWNSRWFWLVIFYQRNYFKPIIELSIWQPHGFSRWFHFWQWEHRPDEIGAYAAANGNTDKGQGPVQDSLKATEV